MYPIIGFSASLLKVESGTYLGLERSCVIHNFIQIIEEWGGVPLILPVVEKQDIIEAQLDLVDGIILTGGQDIHPLHYHSEPGLYMGAIQPKRDHHEILLVQAAAKQRKPILGICRGIQLINVAFGGTLIQDIPSEISGACAHSQNSAYDVATHNVKISRGSRLERILGTHELMTNSFHHQAIKNVAPHFQVNAQTLDGVIEGIESDDDSFVLGVQWHPEVMLSVVETKLLFQAFINAASEREKYGTK